MNPLPTRRFLIGDIPCSTHSIPEFLDEIRTLLLDRALRPRTLLCINAHIFNLACSDAALRTALGEARVVTADGMALVWVAPLCGARIAERCNMTEAYHAFLESKTLPASRAVLIGCSQEEAEAAAARANSVSSHCRIVAAYSGFLALEEYPRLLARHTDLDFILVGMGTPRTELCAQLLAAAQPSAIVWGIGGGTVRIESGTMVEAPSLARRLGLQWVHRLASEPRTLWKRYLLGNPLFLWRVLRRSVLRRRTS